MNQVKLREFIKKSRGHSQKRLPPERDLARQLEMSRSELRKGISLLKAEGLIESRQGSGNYIVTKKRQSSINIGVIFSSDIPSDDYYFKKIAPCIKEASQKYKCEISVIESVNTYFQSPAGEKRFIRLVKEKKLDGALIVSSLPPDILPKIDARIPCVLVNNRLSNYSNGIPCVSANHFAAGFMAAKQFFAQGHKSIGYISMKKTPFPALYQMSGLQCATSITDMKFSKKNHLMLSRNYNSLFADVRNFFQRTDARAFFALNDCLLAKVLRILFEEGYAIPDDYQFIGAGNFTEGILCPIPLSTVDLGFERICEEAVKSLKNRLRNKAFSYHKLIEPKLILRKSSLTIPDKV